MKRDRFILSLVRLHELYVIPARATTTISSHRVNDVKRSLLDIYIYIKDQMERSVFNIAPVNDIIDFNADARFHLDNLILW